MFGIVFVDLQLCIWGIIRVLKPLKIHVSLKLLTPLCKILLMLFSDLQLYKSGDLHLIHYTQLKWYNLIGNYREMGSFGLTRWQPPWRIFLVRDRFVVLLEWMDILVSCHSFVQSKLQCAFLSLICDQQATPKFKSVCSFCLFSSWVQNWCFLKFFAWLMKQQGFRSLLVHAWW